MIRSAHNQESDVFSLRTSNFGSGFAGAARLLCAAFVITSALGFAGAKPVGAPEAPQAGSAKQDSRKTANQPQAPSAKVVDNDYIIGPSDVLAVNVWKDAELTRTAVLVRPDGRISLPLAGELEVSGLTALAVQNMVTQKLKEFVSDPQVTVIVQEVRSHTYIIMGKIGHPGSFPLGKPTTVLEAIAIAGGFPDFAKTNKIYIIRRMQGGSVTKLPFNYKQVIKGRDLDENVILKDGDTIVVP